MGWKDLIPWRGAKRPQTVEREAHPVLALQRDMNRVFEDFHRSWMSPFELLRDPIGGAPRVDVEEGRKKVEVTIEVPGLSEEDIELTLPDSGDVLFLRGESRHESSDEEETGAYRTERYYGLIQRSIPLPHPVVMEDAKAKLEKGVLRVVLRKREPGSETKRIHVRPG